MFSYFTFTKRTKNKPNLFTQPQWRFACVWFTSGAQSWTAWPGAVVPGEASQWIPVDWVVETIVDPWIFLSHQHLHTHFKILNKQIRDIFLKIGFGRVQSHHDNKTHVCWPQSFQGFWSISGPPVVEHGAGDIESAWGVNGQLPIDKVLITFTL